MAALTGFDAGAGRMTAAELRQLARYHDERALYFAEWKDASSVEKAANHFIVAEGLRRLARAAR